nr:unnamed protein product [Digitaria exilis]
MRRAGQMRGRVQIRREGRGAGQAAPDGLRRQCRAARAAACPEQLAASGPHRRQRRSELPPGPNDEATRIREQEEDSICKVDGRRTWRREESVEARERRSFPPWR